MKVDSYDLEEKFLFEQQNQINDSDLTTTTPTYLSK